MLLGDSRKGCGAVERVEGEALSLGGAQTLGRAGSRGVEGLGTVGECMMDEHVCFLLRPGVRRRHQCREETGGLKRLDRPQRSRRLLPSVEPGRNYDTVAIIPGPSIMPPSPCEGSWWSQLGPGPDAREADPTPDAPRSNDASALDTPSSASSDSDGSRAPPRSTS